MLNLIQKYFKRPHKPLVYEYGLIYFDHIQADYNLLKSKVTDQTQKDELERILDKRKNHILTWDDIYAFEIIILQYQDAETIKGKILSLENKLKNLITPTEFENSSIVNKTRQSLTNADFDEKELRAKYRFLVGEFCTRYALLSSKEKLRTTLLRSGAILTLFFFVLSASIAYLAARTNNGVAYSFSTLLIVIFAGVTGAFVSVQQRIQTSFNQGEPMLNLSLLTHGWLSIFLSPLTGAIFAIVLYLFFVGNVLTGKIFPNIKTPPSPPEINITLDNQVAWKQQDSLQLTDFLIYTAPVAGSDFALLLLWSFIAGFAERFVPDTLMRLVNQRKESDESKDQ